METLLEKIQQQELNAYMELKGIKMEPIREAMPLLNIIFGVISVAQNSKKVSQASGQHWKFVFATTLKEKPVWEKMKKEIKHHATENVHFQRLGDKLTIHEKNAFELAKLIFKILLVSKQMTEKEHKHIINTFLEVYNEQIKARVRGQ